MQQDSKQRSVVPGGRRWKPVEPAVRACVAGPRALRHTCSSNNNPEMSTIARASDWQFIGQFVVEPSANR